MSRSNLFRSLFLASSLLQSALISDADAGGKSVTWFLDGSKVEQELVIENSVSELLLPSSLQPGSVRVKPVAAARISRVEFEPVKPGKGEEKELARLDERREELQDRLKALAVKEEIFKSTAKSQGSKAPKRTRTNPEPLSAIRQGTDFAMSRLEDVYRLRRNVEHELKELDRKQSALKKNEKVSGTRLKIRLDGRRGRVLLSYVTAGDGWTPYYDIRLSAGVAEVTLRVKVPVAEKGVSSFVVTSALSRGSNPVPIAPDAAGKVSTYRLSETSERVLQNLQKGVIATIRNDSAVYLPPGEASGFLNEEFIGFSRFSGLKPSDSAEVSFGLSTEISPFSGGSR